MNTETFYVYSFSNIFQVVMDWEIAYQKEQLYTMGPYVKMHPTLEYISCKTKLFFIFYQIKKETNPTLKCPNTIESVIVVEAQKRLECLYFFHFLLFSIKFPPIIAAVLKDVI